MENYLTAYKKQTYKYVPPTPPRNLIDSTTFTIDFVARKFIHIGLSPDNIFHLELHIITSSRHVVISPELLKRIYALMGHILSIILDTCDKSKNHVILEDSKTIITKMVYRGENMLVIESKNNIGCRILLSRTDLLTLQDLEMSIFEVAIRKNEISRPLVIEQIEEMASYFFTHVKSFNTREDMFQHVKNNKFNLISHIIPRNKHKYYDFIPELKLWAIEEIVQRWTMLIDAQNKRDEEVRIIFYFDIQIYIYILCIYIYNFFSHKMY